MLGSAGVSCTAWWEEFSAHLMALTGPASQWHRQSQQHPILTAIIPLFPYNSVQHYLHAITSCDLQTDNVNQKSIVTQAHSWFLCQKACMASMQAQLNGFASHLQ